MQNWFEELFGFNEASTSLVKENITFDGQKLKSKVNNREFNPGKLEVITLKDLRQTQIDTHKGSLVVKEIIDDVQALHKASQNNTALFQVASQFNLLEMVNPQISPEEGVSIYGNDYTQGPACAIACGPATVYRNYFIPVNNQIGQTADNQIDCLGDIGRAFGNEKNQYWEMKNGYCIASSDGLIQISQKIDSMDQEEYDELMGKLKVGIQWCAQVTLPNTENIVSQVFCSALPVAYSHLNRRHWASFAQLILNAAYEATFYLATQNMIRNGNNQLFLTYLGGGAFGNRIEWIVSAMKRSIEKFKNVSLDVMIVTHKYSNKYMRTELGLD